MAITAVLDTVSDAEVQQSLRQGQSRIVRTAIVKGLDSTTTNSKEALLAAINLVTPALPLLGDPFSVSLGNYLLMHKVARGIENTAGTMARVWMHYEKIGGGGTPLERFAAEDGVTLSSEPTNVFPGYTQQLLCSTTTTSPTYNGTLAATDRPLTANYPRTLRSLVLYGLFSDRPNDNVLKAANKVNNATWQGLPAGYWRCEGAKVRYSSRDGMYAVSAGFLNKGDGPGEDWSTYEIPRNPVTGQLEGVNKDRIASLQARPYFSGIQSDKESIFMGGFYRTANFASIFGSTFPIGD